jgi:GrpB-like predicted nucleotidyltransferase (UPF0157 family)
MPAIRGQGDWGHAEERQPRDAWVNDPPRLDADSPEIGRYLRFRDRLRADPGDRELYERVKRELAARRWTYVKQYADAKTEVIAAIMARAEAGPNP